MKRQLTAIIISVLFILTVFSGCSDKIPADYTVDLSETPVSTDYNIPEIEIKETVRVDFIVPESGYIKLLSYDCTEYEEWPEFLPEAYVNFIDKNGKELYPETPIYGGYTEKYLFDKGTVTAVITYKNFNSNMDSMSLIWAFAPENADLVPIKPDSEIPAVAPSDNDGNARFTFTAAQDGLYSFICAEACIFESDCKLNIATADGTEIARELFIHGTEWASRCAFLEKGDYIITLSEISGVASCKVRSGEKYDNIIVKSDKPEKLPVNFGFNTLNSEEKSAVFTCDGSAAKLVVKATGINTYYDYEQGYTLKITDSHGNIVLYDEEFDLGEYYYEGEQRFDLTGCKGEYTVTVATGDACVISLYLLEE